MARPSSTIAPQWRDYTALPEDLLQEAARLTPSDLQKLSRDGFRVMTYDTFEEFYLAEALEYIEVWRQTTPYRPGSGTCEAEMHCPIE